MTESRAKPRRARVVAALGLSLLLLLAVEGLQSLAGRGSFFGRLRQTLAGDADELAVPGTRWRPLSDAERQSASSLSPGLYQAHADPRVAYTLRAEDELAIYDARVRTDALGLRRRGSLDEALPEEDVLRVVLLGASIPFGFGVTDEQAPAQVLERLFAERRSPGSPRVICRTVAVPRWGHRNAVAFLLDHREELQPDIVIYMPVGNDISDTGSVDQSGHLRPWPDMSSRHVGITISDNAVVQSLIDASVRLRELGDVPSLEFAGASALRTGLGPESVRRYEDAVSSVEQLESKFSRLLVVRYRHNEQTTLLLDHAARRGLRPETMTLFGNVTPRMTLGHDPHPSAETQATLAMLIAERLVALGWVEIAPEPALPELSGAAAEQLAPALDGAALAAQAEQARQLNRALLRPVIEPGTGEGLFQVYGGIGPGGLVGPGLLAMLGLEGERLELVLQPLPERPGLYPFDVVVRANGELLGRMTLGPTTPVRVQFELPASLSEEELADIELRAEHWGVVSIMGRSLPASFRLLRMACVEP